MNTTEDTDTGRTPIKATTTTTTTPTTTATAAGSRHATNFVLLVQEGVDDEVNDSNDGDGDGEEGAGDAEQMPTAKCLATDGGTGTSSASEHDDTGRKKDHDDNGGRRVWGGILNT